MYWVMGMFKVWFSCSHCGKRPYPCCRRHDTTRAPTHRHAHRDWPIYTSKRLQILQKDNTRVNIEFVLPEQVTSSLSGERSSAERAEPQSNCLHNPEALGHSQRLIRVGLHSRRWFTCSLPVQAWDPPTNLTPSVSVQGHIDNMKY